MNATAALTLNNGIQVPPIGLGVYQVAPGIETEQTVTLALECGYRLVDTARYYENEQSVGQALRSSGIPREQLFVTTKLWNTDHGFDQTLRAFDDSLKKLRLHYLDLYLIHWPVAVPHWQNWKPVKAILERVRGPVSPLRMQSWRAMERIVAEGRCRAIGVSNYTIGHLEELLSTCKIVPAVNQVEFSPFLYQQELLAFCRSHGIQLEAYSPLTRGQQLRHPVVTGLAEKYQRSPAQILLRWAIQHAVLPIPKAVKRSHLQENISVFDFSIAPGDMTSLDSLNQDLHLCWDPTGVV